jgi:hypothetical protein
VFVPEVLFTEILPSFFRVEAKNLAYHKFKDEPEEERVVI